MIAHTPEVDVAKAPTCTSKGVRTYTCTVCGETRTEDIDMIAHTPEVDVAKAPTCTETGLMEGSHCSVCDTVIVAQETIPATGHTVGNEWHHDDNYHWHACTVCNAIIVKAEHTFDENKQCTVCHYVTKKLLGVEVASTIYTVSNESLFVSVANSEEIFSFENKMELAKGATFKVYSNIDCTNEIVDKSAGIVAGNNKFYIIVTNGEDTGFYVVTVRRRPIYTVTFNTSGGSFVGNQQIEEGSFAIEPTTAVTKIGYTFKSWEYDFTSPVMSDTQIMAIWTPITYTISYELTGGTNNPDNPTSYIIESSDIILATPTRLGYTFAGWSNDGKITANSIGNKTFTASWTPITYTISYELNGGINNPGNPSTYTIESAEITIDAPIRTGYTFAGWSDNGKITSGSTGNKTFTANWNENTYTVILDANNGVVSPTTLNVTFGTNLILPSPERTGYEFAGWFCNTVQYSSGTWLTPNNLTLVAKWTARTDVSYVVEHYLQNANDDGYTKESTQNFNGTADSNITPQVKSYTHFVSPSSQTVKISHDGSLIVKYYYNRTTHNLTYITNGGDAIEKQTYKYDQTLVLATPSRIGFTFGGWFTDKQLTIPYLATALNSDATIYAYWTEENKPTDFSYSGTYSITVSAYNGTNTTMWIPAYIGGVPVTKIGDGAFRYQEELVKVVIPDGLISIGSFAFNYCPGLTSITIPDSVTNLGDYAFYNSTGLKSVTIGKNVTSIGDYTFYNCTGLTSITIPDGVTSIGEQAFYFCDGLSSITIPSSMTSIGANAFDTCDYLYIIFNNSNLDITIGSAGNGRIAYFAKVIVLSDGTKITKDNFIFTDEYFLFETYSSRYRLISYAGNENIVTLPENINGAKYSIYRLKGVKNVIIPDGFTSISDEAFSNCYSLISITIPDSVTSIGSSAFYGCSSLKCLTIPDNVNSIGSNAFGACISLTSINVGSNNSAYTSIDGILFNKNITEIICYPSQKINSSYTIPNSVTSIGNYAFSYCTSLTSIIIPDSVTSIGNSVFYYCTSLTSMIIPDSVIRIGSYAFSYCTSLLSITLPNSITSIETYTFADCYDLKSIIIPDSVTRIEQMAFGHCFDLQSIKMPDSLTKIGINAFFYCSSLTSIIIPDTLTSIDIEAFFGMDDLVAVYYEGTATDWNKIRIGSSNSALTSVTRYYFSETEPALDASGTAYDDNYWRYVDGVPTVWVKE